MTYSSIGIIALLVLLIVNTDVFRKSTEETMIPAHKEYRRFLTAVILYYITDILWGVLDEAKLMKFLYADTDVYYFAMALSVLMWTHYVISYLNEQSRFGRIIHLSGQVFFLFEVAALIANFFVPIMFSFDESGNYHAGLMRHASFIVQIVLFLMVSAHTLIYSVKVTGSKRRRYRTIGLFGIEMVVLILVQVYYPLLPLYAIGCLLGTCLLHTFVLEDEKEEYRKELESILRINQKQQKELGSAKQLAYTDVLTGVKSRHAYIEAVKKIDIGISQGIIKEFGVVVFDFNDLKRINDTQGHEAGDEYIRSGCTLICESFRNSPVYRIGGDEFTVILQGLDFIERKDLLFAFDVRIDENVNSGAVVVSTGIDIFDPNNDMSFSSVFDRADKKMYARKTYLKSMSVSAK